MKADVLIIGGGGAGVSAALHLAKRGTKVVLLERGLIGGQASGVNHGGVRQQGRHPAEIPLAIRSRRLWSNIQELCGTDVEFDPCGHLKLARNAEQEADLVRWNEMAKGYGLETTMFGRNAIRADYPYFGEAVIAGSLLAEDGSANPRLLAPALARMARAAGATLLENHKVEAIEAGFRVLANGQEFTAPILLNTAGFWGGEIAAQFGEPVPVESLNPNMLVTEPLPYFCSVNVGVVGGDVYLRQIPRGSVIIGGGHGENDPAMPWSRPLPEVTIAAAQLAIELVPMLAGAQIIRSWTGIDGKMPDAIPVIGRSSTTPGLFHAFGFSGHGFQLGPGIGAIMAELVVDGRTDIPLDAFRIERFAQP